MQQTQKILMETGKSIAVADCRNFLLKVYKRLGAKELGIQIDHPFYPNEKMHVIYFDVGKSTSNIFVSSSPIYWAKVVAPMTSFLKKRTGTQMNVASQGLAWTMKKILQFVEKKTYKSKVKG